MKKIVKGNDFTLRIPVMKMVEGQPKAFPLTACTDVVVQVCNQFKRIPLAFEIDVKEDNVLLAKVEGDKMSLGTYAIEVKGKIFGNDWRSNEYPQFAIVANNADADTEFGTTDEGDNSVEMDTAMVILPPTVELSDLIDKANEALKNSKETNDTLNANEEARKEAETLRGTAEQGRVSAEKARVSAEGDRTKAEEARISAEAERVKAEQVREKRVDDAINDLDAHKTAFDAAENLRVQSEKDRQKAESLRVQTEKKRVAAEEKRMNDTNKAIQAAETATAGAETCNVTMQGSTISVTNRHGETKSVDVINTDEEVTVTIASSVDSINVAGIKINVFLNNGKTPQTYTTNAEGKVTFTIDRGNYYQVVLPEYGNAQPIAPVGYTAVLGSRNINVEYLPYDEGTSEKVIVNVQKCGNDNECAAWEGIPVTITFDGKDSVVNTDSNGQVVAFVPFGKEYAVKVEDKDGYNVSYNRNVRTFKAELPKRIVVYKLYKFRAGVFILDTNRNEYYLDEWIAAGRNADDAVAIKVADASLSINHGTFCIRTSDIKNVPKLINTSWCTQNLQFNSIALNGNNVKDANYYNGESSSYLIRQEAQERSLYVPAFDYAYGQIFNLGGEDLHGFIMSVGQEYVHVANIGIIKQVLETLYGETVATDYYNFVIKKYRWTSTQYSATSAWYYSSSANYSIKSFSCVVLPVFAC